MKDGGPAFPTKITGEEWEKWSGMSLRDWFASMAMAALVGKFDAANVASNAYYYADKMLEEREK